jgi:hypothetical protein
MANRHRPLLSLAPAVGLHVSSNPHKVEVVDADGRPVDVGDGGLILTSLRDSFTSSAPQTTRRRVHSVD